jgi:methylmalonyl-CoA mutase N-terminal domain/subunit
MTVDAELERSQVDSLRTLRSDRDQLGVDAALSAVAATAQGEGNLLYPMKEALAARATVGEVSAALGSVFGAHGS